MPVGQPVPKRGPLIVRSDGERKFAIAKRGVSRTRLGAGANIHWMKRGARLRKTTMSACSSTIAIGCRAIATVSRNARNGAIGMATRSRGRVTAIEGIDCTTAAPMKRGRNLSRLVMSQMSSMNPIVIVANDRANGDRMTNQKGVLATRIETSGPLRLRRGAIAKAASTMIMG